MFARILRNYTTTTSGIVLFLSVVILAQNVGSEWKTAWPKTDFSKLLVDLSTLQSGGPPRDGIPPLDRPQFVSVTEAAAWIRPQEPVIFFEVAGDRRAYPLQIMIWHEIVNDTVGGVPVSVTFCPLCYSAIAFDRRIAGKVYDFGTSGLLRYSDLVMYDRQTESLWQQLTGQAIVGQMTGRQLVVLPASIIGFEKLRAEYPKIKVLSRDTGHTRNYGSNPYAGYDDVSKSPFLYRGPSPKGVRPMERLVTVLVNDEPVAYRFSDLKGTPVLNDEVGGVPIVVFYESKVRTALGEKEVWRGRTVGAGSVFDRRVQHRTLTFTIRKDQVLDHETASVWNHFGFATEGPLKGQRLTQVVSGDFFAFAWMAFQPNTRIYRPK